MGSQSKIQTCFLTFSPSGHENQLHEDVSMQEVVRGGEGRGGEGRPGKPGGKERVKLKTEK